GEGERAQPRGGEAIRHAFVIGARAADISLIEGNHALFDDSVDEDGRDSTASLSRMLSHTPIVLVINAARMGRSVAALVRGFQTFEPDTNIAAVILNNVGNPRHERKLRDAIERYCGIPVLGALPHNEALVIPDRHLGLVPRGENDQLVPAIAACQRAAEDHIDLDRVLALACSAPLFPMETLHSNFQPPTSNLQIGVIRDRAFSFYYPENFEALENAGAQLVFIDALNDARLPDIHALYIGGGFPEMFMDELAANRSLRQSLRDAIERGLPVYAECGGLMYLSRRIVWGDRSAEMVGALPYDVEMMDRPQGHGYVIAEVVDENPFLPKGTVLRGHEFHHSRLINVDSSLRTAYALTRGNGISEKRDGLIYRSVLAGYMHLHAAGAPGWAEALVGRARVYANEVAHATV
ncbi:MAG: hydrogenobyrinic acid a,c-diamide synthase (glutamine-hydrolyzing), partial [Chloroflexi bacterium]|nr:hydrogenobyrinic acid a,c-diamide synthase (glutamine-hydrolyzing) [Chloroflexota bacterium]